MQRIFGLDVGLMSKACILDEKCLPVIDPNLKRNRAFVRKVLLGNPLALQSVLYDPDLLGCMDRKLLAEVLLLDPVVLRFVSHDHQRLYPDLVEKAFGTLGRRQQQVDRDAISGVASWIAPGLWQNRDTLLQWFRSGLPFTARFQRMGTLAGDQEIFLLIAEHCQQEHRRWSFAYASPALRANKVFMTQAVKHDTSLFGFASAALQQDFDLALLAFAAEDPAVVGAYLNVRHHPNQRRFVESFHRQVRGMLSVHTAFWTLLCGMLPDSGSTLTVLNQGSETSLGYKQLIAALLDVQTGKKLRLLRRACTNLEQSRHLWDVEDDDSENEDSEEEGSEEEGSEDLEGEDSDEDGSEDLESEDSEDEEV